jgi:hypothetical protein
VTTLRPATLGVRANVEPKSRIPIGAKVEISPKRFTLGVKAEIEKKLFDLPQVLINVELYGLVFVPRLKKGYRQIWEANLQPPRSMF